MSSVRRIYLYLVAAISLVAVTWSVIGLTRLILSEGIGEGQITGLATMLAVIIVGLPIFLFHWLMAQRLAARSTEEQESPIRQLYFYGVMAIGAAPIISNIYRLVENGLVALVGGSQPDYYPYNMSSAEHIAAILVWAVIWFYLWRMVRRQSKRQDSLLEINLTIRRIYLLGFALGGLVMVSWGVVGLLQTLMQAASAVFWHNLAAGYLAQLIVGTVVWVGHWGILQQAFASGQPAEERSTLRKVYLYLAVFAFSVMALGGGAALLKRFIELALGAPPAPEPLLTQLSSVVPMLIAGVIFWAYHWRVLQQDARQAPEAPRQAAVRRIYVYLVAAVGLAVLLGGVGGLLLLLIDIFTSPATIGAAYYREQTAWLTAMILVGLPVWWLPWQAMQKLTALPASPTAAEMEASANERRSLARKIYLYFYVFLASMVIFGSVGWFVFHILTALLGADLPDDFMTQVLNALALALLAVIAWLYHWGVIRQDGQLEEKSQARRLADILVVVIDGDEGKFGQTIIRRFQQDLPGIQVKPLGVTPKAVEAMAGQPFSAALINMAHYIIGPWQVLSSGEVAPVLAASPAPKLVAPLVEPNWFWAGVKRQSLEYYARQAVQGVKQAIEGQEITFERGLDVGTTIAIVVGVVVLLCIGGSLFSIGLNIF